jgi:hypothetical protein
MLPIELRAAGVSSAWNEIHRQWQLPFAILAANASPRPTQAFAPSLQLLRNLPTRRKNHSSHDLRAALLPPEPNIHPESLHDTLEAHRSANRLLRHYKHGQNEDDEPEPRSAAFLHSKKAIGRLRRNARGGEDVKQRKSRDAVSPWQIHRPDIRSPVSRALRPRAPAVEKVTWKESVDQLRPMQEHSSYASHPATISYQGVSQQPRNEWNVSIESPIPGRDSAPWLAHLPKTIWASEDVQAYLTAEILAFEKYMESTAAERAAVEQALKDIRSTIATFDPGIKISVVGSRSTGLAMPLSDIDVNLHDPKLLAIKGAGLDHPTPEAAKPKIVELLAHIKRKLKKRGGPSPVFIQSRLIEAKVPIVSARHIATGLPIQINCTPDGHASTELVRSYLDEFPTLRPLFFVLRQTLTMRALGDAASHGIGSYALLMMIVAALKFSATRFHPTDAGHQLLYFLDFYSKIDFRTTCIAVDPPELFAKTLDQGQARQLYAKAEGQGEAADETASIQAENAYMEAHDDDDDENAMLRGDDRASINPVKARARLSLVHRSRDYLMCLQDPGNAYNDLGSRATAIKHVKATFATLATKLGTAMELFEDRDAARYPPFSLLSPCLQGNYQAFKKQREQLNCIGERMAVRPVIAKYL